MQTQKRPTPQPAPTAKKPVVPATRSTYRSAPVALDDRAMRQVSGAGGEGPYKGW